MALFKQSSTAYRLNYLWYTKKAIADAINEVGKNKGISVNPRQDFAKFAEKILKLETSVWSSAFIKVEPVGNENPRAEHWFEYIDEYFQPSEDIVVDPTKQYYKQPPHSLVITENGYYKVSDLSLKEFGEADVKTVASSFYVSVQSAPIIIGNGKMECGTITHRGTKSPNYDFDESFTGNNLTEILTQFVNRLGPVMGAQVVKDGSIWTVTFDNGKVITISESGSINSASGIFLAAVAYGGPTFPITFRIIKNTKAIFFTTIDVRPSASQAKSFILATTDRGEDAAWIHLGTGEHGNGAGKDNIYVVLNGAIINYPGFGYPDQQLLPFPTYRDGYSYKGQELYANDYMLYSVIMIEYLISPNSYFSIVVDFGENLFVGPVIYAASEINPPVSFDLNSVEFSVLLKNTCFWQRKETS